MHPQDRPAIYAFSHFLFGFLGYYSTPVLVIVLMYQIGQQIFNVRVFPLEGSIKPGNNRNHTLKKLVEVGLGYLFAHVWTSRRA